MVEPSRSNSVSPVELEAFTKTFSQILEDSLEGIRRNVRQLNEENTHSFFVLSNAVQELRPKKGPQGISRAPTFSGENDDAGNFLDKFELYGKFHKWNNDEMLQAFPLSLSGTAEIWYSTLDKATFTSYAQLAKLFRDRFLSPASNWVLRQQLGQRKQSSSESLNEYSADIRRRCQRLGIPISEQLHYFIQGLRPDLRDYVILQQPKSLEDAENAARIKDSLGKSPSSNLTASDVLAMQQNFIRELEQKQLLAKPTVAAYEQERQPTRNSNDDSIRHVIREELRSMGSNFRGAPPSPRLQFNSRGRTIN